MKDLISLYISLLALSLCAAIFLHQPSLIPIHPLEYENQSDFGFAMGFQFSKNKSNLIVGAPSVDLKGKVFSCDMNNASYLKEITCQESYIIDNLFKKSLKSKEVRNQHFYTGASIAATSDYFLTCAPLWTSQICGIKSSYYDAFGMCFVYKHNITTRYSATYKEYCEQYYIAVANGNLIKNKDNYNIHGGTGWSTKVDTDLGLLLIIKSSNKGDIVYTPLNNPTAKTRSMVYYKEMNFIVEKFYNLGFGITSGKFFSNKTVFAFSMTTKSMGGVIEFIEYNTKTKHLSVMNKYITSEKYTIHVKAVGTMFGSALAAADLNLDRFDELLVGAPVHTEEDCVECGALYVYLGGDVAKIDKRNRLRIIGTKDFGRFGTSLEVKDLDGDGISELAVSAPYEDEGLGSVYILSGYEIHRKLETSENLISLLDLKHTQSIQKETFRTLGFSLQFISDVDNNGCSELVAGSPGSGAAVLLLSLQTINVKLSCKLIGEQLIREQDLNFTVEICVIVEYPKPPNNIYGHLTLINSIIGDAAFLPNTKFHFDITCEDCKKSELFCKNNTVELKDKEPRVYKFISEAKLHTEHIFNSSVMNNSWVVTSPYSKLNNIIEVSRHCSGNDCIPRLSLEILWSGRKDLPYILGSSASETVTIRVHNDGNSSYEACVWVRVKGVQLSEIGCALINTEYRCEVLKPLRRGAEQLIKLLLKMRDLTNLDKELIVEARLYENCNKANSTGEIRNITIPYVTNTDGVFINGILHSRNVTDKEIQDDDEFYDDQEYLITNNGSVTWKTVVANILLTTKPFINSFKVSADKIQCIEFHTDAVFNLTCTLDLKPNSTQKIIATTGILKTQMKKNLVENKLKTTSHLDLYLVPTSVVKTMNVTSIIFFEDDSTVGSNKWLIALIAAIIAILILIVIAIVLYKYGFFKRKQKQRLRLFRESIKQRSSRRNTHISSVTDEQGLEEFQMEPEDDCAFENIPIPKTIYEETEMN